MVRIYIPTTSNLLVRNEPPNFLTNLFFLEDPDSKNSYAIEKVFQQVYNLSDADYVLLPMTWNYYEKQVEAVSKYVKLVNSAGKKAILWSEGDFTARLPFSGNILFEQSGYRSRRSISRNQIFAIPSFVRDYTDVYCGGTLPIRSKGGKPAFGFCGQGGGNIFDYTRRFLSQKVNMFQFKLHMTELGTCSF